jgi:hypothetical protein
VPQPTKPPKSGITKWDVEMVKARNEGKRIAARWKAITWIGCTLAVSLPIFALKGIVEPIAGHTTVINASLALGTVAGVSITLNLGQAILWLTRRKTIQRLRSEKDQEDAALGIELEV